MTTKTDTNNSTKARSMTTTRQAALPKCLRRKSGATVAELQEAFGWQSHSVRAALSGLRNAGDIIERFQSPRGSAYRIVRPEADHDGA